MRKKLLIVDRFPTSLTYKLLYFLKDYFEITLILLANKEKYPEKVYKNLEIKIYSFNPEGAKLKEGLKFIFRLAKEKTKRYNFVLAKTAPNWIGYLLFKIFKKSKKIYFPYDIYLFVWNNVRARSKLDIISERYNFEHADFIIHKGPKNELNLIKKNEVKKIKGKPIQFLPYCFDEWIMPIKKEKDKLKGLHVVYIGTAPSSNSLFKIQWPDIFKLIANQKIDLHVYPIGHTKILGKNIHLHKPISNLKLNRIMGKYHYGISLTFFNKKVIDKRMLKTTLGNKIFSYLEAGIPIIADNESEFLANLIRKYKCGIIVSEKDLPNLRKIIEKQNYSELLKGVKKAREELKMSKHIKRLIKELTTE